MRWMPPTLKRRIDALLGVKAGPSKDEVRRRMDSIRQAMLGLLGERGQSDYPSLARRVNHALDVQALWYARSDLMGALASLHGEARAREQVESVNDLFHGVLPESLYGRHRNRIDSQA